MTLHDCLIRNGQLGQAQLGGEVYAYDCRFEDNHAVAHGGDMQFHNCVFEGNSVSDDELIYVYLHSTYMWDTAEFYACQFLNNTAPSIVEVNGCETTMNDCLFAGNVGTPLRVTSSEMRDAVGNTFTANESPDGQIVVWLYSSLILSRSIIADNQAGASIVWEDDPGELVCCDLYGNPGGDWYGALGDQLGTAGNISLDPEFCDPAGMNFHLMESSPCAPFSPPNSECDLLGALPVGCETPVERGSWGEIKSLFR